MKNPKRASMYINKTLIALAFIMLSNYATAALDAEQQAAKRARNHAVQAIQKMRPLI